MSRLRSMSAESIMQAAVLLEPRALDAGLNLASLELCFLGDNDASPSLARRTSSLESELSTATTVRRYCRTTYACNIEHSKHRTVWLAVHSTKRKLPCGPLAFLHQARPNHEAALVAFLHRQSHTASTVGADSFLTTTLAGRATKNSKALSFRTLNFGLHRQSRSDTLERTI